MTHADHDGEVGIIENAAHLFSPDGGKDLNSALEDVAEFTAIPV